jgi:acetyl esterase/lipase
MKSPKLLLSLGLTVLLYAHPSTRTEARQPEDTATSRPSQLAAQITLQTAITYAEPGGSSLKLDMAMPKEHNRLSPAVVALYGGGWISGSRSGMRGLIEHLAAQGYVAVAPSYRLAPEHPFPAAVADVRECVRWLRRHAKEYHIDPDRIGAVGFSAGGHLACMLGVTSAEDNFGNDDFANDEISPRVQAVVNFFGPGDLASDEWSDLAVRKYLIPFLGGTAEGRPEAYRKASPVTYISPDDPPILTFQGDQDRTVPMSFAVALHKKLRQAGVPNELVIVEGEGHGWGEPHRSRTLRQSVRFFNKYLKGPRPCTQPTGVEDR